jgi:hypothetical protein
MAEKRARWAAESEMRNERMKAYRERQARIKAARKAKKKNNCQVA